MTKSTLIVSGAVVLILIVAVLSVGNSVSTKLAPKGRQGVIDWYVKTHGGYDILSGEAYQKWPELVNIILEKKGWKNWDTWKEFHIPDKPFDDIRKSYLRSIKLPETKYSVAQFQSDWLPEVIKNAEYAVTGTTAVNIFNTWLRRGENMTRFRNEYGLSNPVKWMLWRIYAAIYSI